LFFIFFQGVLILASWAASVFDARHLAKPKQYRRRRNTFIKRESHSKITGSLLSATEDWTLLHNILLEKDSRRIFYFMWSVASSPLLGQSLTGAASTLDSCLYRPSTQL
jgi:hypothetical protein